VPLVPKKKKKRLWIPLVVSAWVVVVVLLLYLVGRNASPQSSQPDEPEMVYVQGGTFTMGCTSEQGSDCDDDEKPSHRVTLSSFSIGKYEVTQEQWQAVMGSNPSYFKGDNLPVEMVSWNEVQEFIVKLNQKTGKQYRLPTEAEWEYAARGGAQSRNYKYSGSNNIADVAWCKDNSGDKTHPVGTKAANELGIYDMSGNVREWCSDWRGSYSSNQQQDPKGPSSGSDRVIRGGSWLSSASDCRVSIRNVDKPTFSISFLGFRLALSL
jgi:formylglycine-generating enzyme required for sulfatase activity